ncbi:MAG: oxidoreductase [Myxococcales bacterium]|nr:oxidoreductase [Myxococcales bacterium]
MKEYDGKVRVVFKNMVVHPQQVAKAHNATCAAAKQGKFLEYYMAFWDKAFTPYAQSRDPSKLGEENILAIAKDIGTDPAKFKADMDSPECAGFVQADMAELAKFKVNATPAFFINGKFVGGALPKEGFKQIIDERLKVAQASGVSPAEYYSKEVMGKGLKQFKSAAQ